MKITIKIDNIEISIDEQMSDDRGSSIQWKDQNAQIQSTLKVMTDECVKLLNVAQTKK